ncbi:serine hydrolase domain-containing protein [Promicromonospora sukumoe]|uniref:serine hydrolase domain-containing protein n=1 Tax=Promicromonospora sukumoe TaxID=88382 RepID=UPI00037F351A|nr:serine hydrolase domain-containing protein [Promicromonospora sukumoe]
MTAPSLPASQAVDREQLQRDIEKIVGSGFTGMQVRVHDERGDWTGVAGRQALGDDTLPPVDGHVRIGSNTKTFAATVALALVGENVLGLDRPVHDELPELGLDPRITLRMLLQHTSGVFNFTGEYYDDGTFVPGIPATQSGKEWVDNRFRTYAPEELVGIALSNPARFEPGTDWSYSNTNYVLVRLLIERVTGRSLAEETQRLVLGPLALTGTVLPGTSQEIPAPYAHAYYRYDDGGAEKTVDVSQHNPSWIATGGDMISTTQDLQTFIIALVTGKLLPAELLTEMLTPHPKAGYGLGVFVQPTEAGGTVITHNGGIAGHAALMYSAPDGSRTLTGALYYVDDATMSMGAAFQQATQLLVRAVFGGDDVVGEAKA